MEVKKNGTQPSGKGPEEYFTGSVRIDPLFEAPEPSRGRGALVTFEPGARTAWHWHPLGQTLVVQGRRKGIRKRRGGADRRLEQQEVTFHLPGRGARRLNGVTGGNIAETRQ